MPKHGLLAGEMWSRLITSVQQNKGTGGISPWPLVFCFWRYNNMFCILMLIWCSSNSNHNINTYFSKRFHQYFHGLADQVLCLPNIALSSRPVTHKHSHSFQRHFGGVTFPINYNTQDLIAKGFQKTDWFIFRAPLRLKQTRRRSEPNGKNWDKCN